MLLSRLTFITRSAFAFVALAAAATPSFAVLLIAAPGNATYYFGAPTGNSVFPPSLPQVINGSQLTDGGATADLALQPSPNLTLNLSGPHSRIGTAVVYNYTISGPFGPSNTVAGMLTASMSVNGTGFMYGIAGITGTNIDVTPNNAVCFSTLGLCAANGYGNYSSSLSNRSFNVNFQATGQIELAALAQVSMFGSASAMVDPVITLPSGYTLMLSAGAGNTAPVPEPATLLMLAAGLGVVGVRVRRLRG